MWPGDQHGGQQNPQGAPSQQPPGPHGQPNPYAQPGYPQQPPPQPQQPQQPPQQDYPPTQPYGVQNPYAQPPGGQQPPAGYPAPPPPPGYPAPQRWGPPVPGGSEGPKPPGGRRNLTIGIAVAAAVAVIAAVVVAAVHFTGGKKKDEAGHSPTPTASATTTATPAPTTPDSTESAVTAGSGDSPRGAPGALDVKPVVPGWKVVKRTQRNVAFDVPPNWTVDDEGMEVGFSDKSGDPAVLMGAPAFYKHNRCKNGNNSADGAGAGTKGANGASSLRNAAEVQATAWAYWAFQENGKGTFSKALDSRAFQNAYGISGWQARATATRVPKAAKCSSDGAAYAVAWIDPTQSDPTQRLVVWVLYCQRGVSDQVSDATIAKIESTIRLIRK